MVQKSTARRACTRFKAFRIDLHMFIAGLGGFNAQALLGQMRTSRAQISLNECSMETTKKHLVHIDIQRKADILGMMRTRLHGLSSDCFNMCLNRCMDLMGCLVHL